MWDRIGWSSSLPYYGAKTTAWAETPSHTIAEATRSLALRVLFTVPEPSSADPHGHHSQARYPAAHSSWAQGFQVSISLHLAAEEKARSQTARTRPDPSHL